MDELSKRFWAWYDAHVVARWYRSWALWVGFAGGAAPYLIDILQAGLDSWSTYGNLLNLSPAAKETVRLILLFVVLPAAKAWQQKSMQEASIKQAESRGDVIVVPKVDGASILSASRA